MTPSTTTTNTNGKPIKGEKTLFVLWYLQGSNMHPLTKNFYFEGDVHQAAARAKRHLEVQGGCRFIRVVPFITDLDKADNFLLEPK